MSQTPDDTPNKTEPAEKDEEFKVHSIKSGEILRGDHQGFTVKIERLIREAEDLRMTYMRKHQAHSNLALSVGLFCVLLGAGGFGWFLLMEADIIRALACISLAIVIPLFLNFKASGTLKAYRQAYKTTFLPQLAQALGGFNFYPSRGISEKIIRRTGVLPAFDRYTSEDCFMGRYKGVKVIFSEAKLFHSKQGKAPIFNGVFVLLETPEAKIDGHTILTSDQRIYQSWRDTRWKKLSDLSVEVANKEWDRFKIVSDNPAAAQTMITQDLLKELSEAADIYNQAPISTVMFHKKLIFIMIPYDGDMFEPSTLHFPIATRQHAVQCKREVEQILEIIDVFDIYKKAEAGAKPGS